MNLQEIPREELLASLNITTDEALELFSRDTLLSALGFDTPGDFLDEVTLSDAMEYYSESDIVESIDINEYWDMGDAYNRYGSELLEYFEDYRDTSNWGAADHIENYGDGPYLLAVLLDGYIDVDDLYSILPNSYKEGLSELLKPTLNIKHELLSTLLKANYEALKEIK